VPPFSGPSTLLTLFDPTYEGTAIPHKVDLTPHPRTPILHQQRVVRTSSLTRNTLIFSKGSSVSIVTRLRAGQFCVGISSTQVAG
jgi:hypothetical protein